MHGLHGLSQNANARGVRLAVVTLGVAVLTAIAGCSDEYKTITAPKAPRTATTGSGNFGQERTLTLCVDASSPNTTYTFVNQELNRNVAQDSWSNALTGNGFFDGTYWNDPGDGGNGTTTANALEGIPYTVSAGGCITVLFRNAGDAGYMAKLPINDHTGLGQCDPSQQACGGINDSFAAANILYVSNPLGAVYDHTDCYLDEGVLFPEHINPTPNTMPWPSGGFNKLNPPVNYDCGSSNNPTRAFVNFEHGTTVTFFFKPAETTPCPAGSFKFNVTQNGDLNIVYDQFPAPNDNSYGINAVGWPSGHTFSNLTGSDHAGIQLRDQNGVVKLSFNIDYLTAKNGTPSGYASLGPFAGDGDVVVGSLTPADITYTTSLAENLNSLGYFTGGVQTVGTAVANLLVNSPPTLDKISDYTLTPAAAAAFTNGWNFHDTYFVTLSAAKLASIGFNPATWSVEPNLSALHNSPAKACPAAPIDCAELTVGAKTLSSKEVKVHVNNTSTTTDAFVTGVHLTWPVGANGALKQIKIGGDVIWSGADLSGNVNFALADLVTDATKRRIAKKSAEDVKFVFANNVVTSAASYTGSLDFGGCNKPLLP